MEQGLRARKEGLAKELRNSLGQEIKVSETIRKRLFGTVPKAESIKQSLNEPAEKSQRYKEQKSLWEMRQQAVREDVRSKELKNSLGKEAKGC